MQVKTCKGPSCLEQSATGIEQPIDAFAWKDKKRGKRNSWCKSCHRNYAKSDYQNKKDYYKEKSRRSNKMLKARNRERLRQYLLDHPCVDCGESSPVVLEFDHVRGKKLSNVSNLAQSSYSWSRIAAEIEKCEVRCANCHRKRTAKTLWEPLYG